MIPNEIFPKLKPAIKLSTRQNGDGNEVEVEVRENEEQLIKFQEIVDLLVAAGYFRARIKGLSSFDKVVGGMTWCIENCNFDIDVDLLFQENSTIGQKIALTEKIVAVLPKMKCPYRIEPHQIQGLDFIHIFPVVQWLVKRWMEFRQETFQFVRLHAISQFSKSYTLNEEIVQNERITKCMNNVQTVRNSYRPKREYRLKHAPPKDELDRVQVTLLEYGYRTPTINLQTEAETHHPPDVQSEETRVKVLLKKMALMDIQDVDYESLINFKENIEIEKHYALLQAEIQDGDNVKINALENEKQILTSQMEKLKARQEQLTNTVVEEANSLQETNEMRDEALSRLQKITIDHYEKDSDVERLENLIILNERLREHEIQFKEQCRTELDNFQKLLSDTQVVKEIPLPKFDEKMEEYEQKIQSIRRILAKKNRTIAMFQRQLDDIPSRAELAQYQRRFLELYNQVGAKHKETKQYFTLYNTLDDTKIYISKELSLLNSILDNYSEAMESASGKEEFSKQMEQIVEGVQHTKKKVDARYLEEQNRRDNLSHTLQALIAQQRQYVTIVKQLSIECRHNEALLAKKRSL